MYNAYITRIKNVRTHSNADRLLVAECFGNQVIVSLTTKEGDLGIYFPTDGKLGIEYATANNLVRKKDEAGNEVGGYLDPEKRHITSLKLRGEKSDGLFMPIESLKDFCDISTLKEGEMISVINGVVICEKYIPLGKKGRPEGSAKAKRQKVSDGISFPLFKEHIDTSQFAYNLGQFKVGDQCVITLKMHGTSQRTTHTVKEEKQKVSWIGKLFGKKPTIKKTWEHVTGTRRVVLKDIDKAEGFYGTNVFRKQWHDQFVGKLHKGESVFYEVVGYTDDGGLIMPECNNELTKDKEFIKQWGKTTRFTYGCGVGQSDIYVYRMTMTNEDGHIVEYPWNLVKLRCEQMGIKHVPELDRFEFGTTILTTDELIGIANMYVDGADPIGKTHIREGVIVRIENREKFTAFKHKSFNFKVLEGIVKVEATEPDMEEAESEESEESE
jgi:hypothetical protein